MTIAELITQYLESHGLWPAEAAEVLKIMQESQRLEAMERRWNESVESYPKSLLSILLVTARRMAVEHLETTKPLHFALHGLKA